MASLTAQTPDPKTLANWEDAFKYPVPAVRRMEQQLRADVASNRERLRTLVGSSYRDLMGTADAIMGMDVQMRQVESYFGNLSLRCDSRLLEKSIRNTGLLSKHPRDEEAPDLALASQVQVLRRSVDAVLRILKQGGALLLAAKILVLARLLIKKSAASPFVAAFVEGIRTRLARLRHKLLSIVDGRLSRLHTAPESVLDALCTFSLATTSSCADALRHFHHVRTQAICALPSAETDRQSDIIASVELWIETMRSTKQLFPRQLSRALASLKSQPLLQDEAFRNLPELSLDLHLQWLGHDILTFVPYLRHDDLDLNAAAQQLSTWAPATLNSLLTSISLALQKLTSKRVLLELRHRVIDMWLAQSSDGHGVKMMDVLCQFRRVFQTRLSEMIEQKAAIIETVTRSLQRQMQSPEKVMADADLLQNLWSRQTLLSSLSDGARPFSRAVTIAYRGQTPAVMQTVSLYQSWQRRMTALHASFEELRNQRWFDANDLDSSEEDSTSEPPASLTKLLNEEDPQELLAHLARSVVKSVESMADVFRDYAAKAVEQPSTLRVPYAACMLRLLSEFMAMTPSLLALVSTGSEPDNRFQTDKVFAPSLTPLYDAIAQPVVESLTAEFSVKWEHWAQATRVVSRPLWEGSPELPVLPSPVVFSFLRAAEQQLRRTGSDLWTPGALQRVKTLLRAQLAASLGKDMTSRPLDDPPQSAEEEVKADHDEQSVDRDTKTPTAGKDLQDVAMQQYFDVQVLRIATLLLEREQVKTTAGKTNASDALDQLAQQLESRISWDQIFSRGDAGNTTDSNTAKNGETPSDKGQIPSNASTGPERIHADAAAFWARTRLLFGLLAGRDSADDTGS